MDVEERSFRRPGSPETSWMSVWLEFTGEGGVPHQSPRQSGNVVGVCLGGIRWSGSPETSWVSVWVAFIGDGGGELPSTRYSGNVVDVCLAVIFILSNCKSFTLSNNIGFLLSDKIY